MRSINLLKVAAEAELLRLRTLLARQGRRAAFGVVAIIFMLGVLVSLVKLSHDFIIIPGVALWSFGGLTLMLAAVASSFNARDLWVSLEREPGSGISG